MIKRLKWNVLYGSDNDDGAGDLVSSGSEDDFEEAARHLAELAKNDPELQQLHQNSSEEESGGDDFLRDEYSEGDDEDEVAGFDELAIVVANRKPKKKERLVSVGDGSNASGSESESEGEEEQQNEDAEEEEEKFVEWKECNLCPGKRFLNDREVESHLLSKGHNRALKRYERVQKEKAASEEAEQEQVSDADAGQDADRADVSGRTEALLTPDKIHKLSKAKRLARQRSGLQSPGESAEIDCAQRRNQVDDRDDVQNKASNGDLRGGSPTTEAAQSKKVVAKQKPQHRSKGVNEKVDAQNGVRTGDPGGGSSSADAAQRKKLATKQKLKQLKARKWKRQQETLQNQSSPAEKAAEQNSEKVNAGNVKKVESKPNRESQSESDSKVSSTSLLNAKKMNRKAIGAAKRAALKEKRASKQLVATTPHKGPKVKSKKPMSDEKAARKALKRQLAAKSSAASPKSLKRPLVDTDPPLVRRKKVKKNKDGVQSNVKPRAK